jgi:hypothetical protein
MNKDIFFRRRILTSWLNESIPLFVGEPLDGALNSRHVDDYVAMWDLMKMTGVGDVTDSKDMEVFMELEELEGGMEYRYFECEPIGPCKNRTSPSSAECANWTITFVHVRKTQRFCHIGIAYVVLSASPWQSRRTVFLELPTKLRIAYMHTLKNHSPIPPNISTRYSKYKY